MVLSGRETMFSLCARTSLHALQEAQRHALGREDALRQDTDRP